VSFNPTSTADNVFVSINVAQTGTNSTTTIWTSAEAPFSTKLATFTSIQQNKPLVKKLSTHKIWGVAARAVADDDGFGASYNGSPANEWCWIVQWQNIDNTTTNAIMGIRVEVEYDIEFYAPAVGALPDTLLKKHTTTPVGDNDCTELGYVPVLTVAEFNDLTSEELIIRSVLLARERARAKTLSVVPDKYNTTEDCP